MAEGKGDPPGVVVLLDNIHPSSWLYSATSNSLHGDIQQPNINAYESYDGIAYRKAIG